MNPNLPEPVSRVATSVPAGAARPQLFGLLAGFFLAAGLVLAALIVAGAWTRLAEASQIAVTGSARRDVRSDLAVWRARFAVQHATLRGANEALKADLAKVERFLRGHGVADYALAPVQIREVTARGKNEDGEVVSRAVGYQLTQALQVSSAEVTGLPRLERDGAQLLGEGVALVSDGVQFFYTKAGDAKVEMMAEATRDARARADQIAAQGGRRVRELRSARMGVVQINPQYSAATSWEGNNDASSLDKTISVAVSAVFALR